MTKRRNGFLRIALMFIAMIFATVIFASVISGAEETEGDGAVSAPVIVSKNISYESELYTFYAVPCDTVAQGESICLEIMDESGEIIATVTESSIQSVHGRNCYVFKGVGTSVRNIGRVEYVRAVTSDGGVSPTVEYSVLEYLCEKLCKEGYIAFTEEDGADYTRRKLYLQLFKYACSAQNLLGSTGMDLENVSYAGGYGALGYGFFEKGQVANIDFNSSMLPEYRAFDHWIANYYNLLGEPIESVEVDADGGVAISGFVCLTPVYKVFIPDGMSAIYHNSTVTISVMGESAYRDAETVAAEAIKGAVQREMPGCKVKIVYGQLDEGADINIIIGESNTEASAAAYERLDRVRSSRMYSEAKYAIAGRSGQVAIAYDHNEYTSLQSISYVADDFISSFAMEKDMLIARDFVADFEINLIEIQKLKDVDFEEAQWAKLLELACEKYGEVQGTAITEAFKTYYSMRSDNLIVWYANLYDPGVGGFYAGNTGKQYEGFLPLLETTGQLLGHLNSMDVFSVKGDSTKRALPEVIKAQIIYYLKSCQDPNGYFYNPQLGKVATDAALVRRGRDLSRVTSLFSSLGSAPTYNTPTGQKGDGISAEEFWASTGFSDEYKPYVPTSYEDYERHLSNLTVGLGADTDEVVSAILLTSSEDSTEASEAYLKSHAGFAAYIASKNIDANPYSVGNELNGTYRLIEAASKELGAYVSAEGEEAPWYDGMTLCDMLISWMSAHINEKGLFGTIPEGSTNPLDGIKYANANGFFKMITIYNAWKVEYPEPALAAQGLITGIKGDEPSTGNICNVYNSWNALSSLMSNIKGGYGDMSEEDRAEILQSINDIFAEDAPDAIINSYNKQKAYLCADGTFSNSVTNSVANFPGGLGVGLGIKEGNVDAIGFGLYATTNSALSVLGLSSARVDYYHEGDYLVFIEEILNVKPVTEKINFKANDKDFVQDFEDYNPELSLKITNLSKGGEGNAIGVVEVDGNKVVKVDKVYNTTASIVKQYYTYTEDNADRMVFEGRFKIASLNKRAQIQFTVVSSAKSPFLILIDTVSASTSSALRVNGVETGLTAKDWFDLRIEYYVTKRDDDGKAVAFKADAYVNGKFIYETTSFYSDNGQRQIYEVDAFDSMSISFNQPNGGVFYVDDLYMHCLDY